MIFKSDYFFITNFYLFALDEAPRGPLRNAGASRGRGASRVQSHPYAGATRRGY